MRSLIVMLFLISATAAAQGTDTLEVVLPELTVDAVRETESTASAPFALGIDVRSPEELDFEPALALERVLRSLPGIWINDRGHFAVGERISVRGTGARAAFGVRGIQVLLDGIPLTMPDGQAALDVVESSLVRRTELLRSPASLFWGNGSGGVLFLSTAVRPAQPNVRARLLGGSFGQRQVLLEGAVPIGAHDVRVYASNLRQEGYRAYSEGTQRRVGAMGRFRIGDAARLRTMAALATQDTESPSSLTREQMADDPTQARQAFVDNRAGKQSLHAQAGATLDRESGFGTASLTAYGVRRLVENPLPFGFIDLDRTAGGVRTALRGEEGRIQWGVGADGAVQHDINKNFDIDFGEPGDEVELDQTEDVLSAGAFVYGGYELAPSLNATAGMRFSRVRFEMDDDLLANGDQSGGRTFSAWSPTVGLSYRQRGVLLFANYGTAFETPTTTELVNRPDMTGGFNPEIDAKISRGVEVGARGAVGSSLLVDVAVYTMNVKGRLGSFENELGRQYFRNVGENTHRGLEAMLSWYPAASWQIDASYTGSRFEFDEDELSGNLIPGIPEHRLFGAVRTNRSGLWARVEGEVVSEYFVNDANTDVNDGYAVFDLSLGHRGIAFGSVQVAPFATLKNALDKQYAGSVVINAFGGRYYEPAPGRAILAGVQLNFLP
ncbi:MAG: TonB-dependent receptor [Rhodothermales bacterium]